MDKIIAEKILTAMVEREQSWDFTTKKYNIKTPWYHHAYNKLTTKEKESGFGKMFGTFGWNGWNDMMDICQKLCGKTYKDIEKELAINGNH